MNDNIKSILEKHTKNQLGLTLEEYVGFTGVGHIEVIFPTYLELGGKTGIPTSSLEEIFVDKDLYNQIKNVLDYVFNNI